MTEVKKLNVKTLERIMKLMVKYQCELVEYQGVKVLKNKFPTQPISETLPSAHVATGEIKEVGIKSHIKDGLVFGQEIP